ncbi:hypothetical protein TREMEDRAFT_35791 [Tremella mesenterica DSM 1558]|uniref:uncharacterized protein n=1 Tax=Tremella mesenterica (strain ATCC 24925 / CBS 8224 / DSM 1558 / NBRC 9311 / NRRL Y-6157 / RJB 2259-6 / UBC 559-6) TaxID=578456 RepID=UPI00032C444C|nr:uncharacterized protein TREMEDRAFT_35791 [Tremella mesenterica DSM 1558]EIW65825.1 hypothetical protein TREMEDRAFT_35791 [Tremella mesenterica DSM 1558]
MPKIYLLSRTLDPILGIFTGLLAYHLHESNPRSAPPPGHTLRELVRWKWGSPAGSSETASSDHSDGELGELLKALEGEKR